MKTKDKQPRWHRAETSDGRYFNFMRESQARVFAAKNGGKYIGIVTFDQLRAEKALPECLLK